MKLALAVLSALPSIIVPANAQYLAVRDGDVVRLSDKKTDTTVSIIPSNGAVVFEMKVKGQNIINFSAASLDAYRQRPGNTGILFWVRGRIEWMSRRFTSTERSTPSIWTSAMLPGPIPSTAS